MRVTTFATGPQRPTEMFDWDRRRIKSEYVSCTLPEWDHFSGEYHGALLSQDGWFAQWLVAKLFGCYGKWLGKAFSTKESGTGVGYNLFSARDPQSPQQKLPMEIRVGRSELDGGDCVRIDYRNRNRGAIRLLRGEFRQVNDGVLLGLGFCGPTFGSYHGLRRTIPFVMWGPFAEAKPIEAGSNKEIARRRAA